MPALNTAQKNDHKIVSPEDQQKFQTCEPQGLRLKKVTNALERVHVETSTSTELTGSVFAVLTLGITR